MAAYRFPYLLAGNSVVFKQDSPFYEYFYSELIPMHHYIPVKRDLSNLVEQINWAKNNDNLAWKIAKQGQMFANEHLTADRVLCYHVKLLKVTFDLNCLNKLNTIQNVNPIAGMESKVNRCRSSATRYGRICRTKC